jgi:hypothetical protein
MRLVLRFVVLWGMVCACSSASTGAIGAANPVDMRAGWEGHLADRYYNASSPATPALRPLAGNPPLVYLTRTASASTFTEATYELAVFDDGTFVYEGHRCVRVGGVLVTRLGVDTMVRLKTLLAETCTDLAALNDGELCDEPTTLRVRCTVPPGSESGSDHCRKEGAAGRRLAALHAGLLEELGLAMFVGEPSQRHACSYGARDLAPHDLARIVYSSTRPDPN